MEPELPPIPRTTRPTDDLESLGRAGHRRGRGDLDVYRAALEGALQDGVITEREEEILARLRRELEIGEEDEARLRRELTMRAA